MKSFSKILLIGALAVVFVACTPQKNPEAGIAQKSQDQKTKGVIQIEKNDLDLGTIKMSDGTVDALFTFTNTGKEPVVLLNGDTSCMCTEAVVKSADGIISPRIRMPGHAALAQINQVLDPGESATLLATFDPNAHGPDATGPIMRTVTIRTNSGITPELQFNFKGNVVR